MSVLLIQGDSRQVPLADKSVHCCVTSPPYWGLRDYGTGTWVGGSTGCDHSKKCSNVPHGESLASAPTNSNHELEGWKGGICGKCGAIRIDKQLGLERTPEEYIEQMVLVFREVKRVLRDDGTLWMNMGDSYNSGTTVPQKPNQKGCDVGGWNKGGEGLRGRRCDVPSLKVKDLIGVPWMLAFALRSDGWYLRSDIIWSKPNPMPESVTDRPTKAHEYIFLLSKSERYYYDADAILEPVSENTHMRLAQDVAAQIGSSRANGGAKTNGNMKAVARSRKSWNGAKFDDPRDLEIRPNTGRKRSEPGQGIKYNDSFDAAVCLPVDARNKRSVWTVNVQGFAEAHFATFPEELIKPCILAGCPAGGIVLDPFIGSGTTALVARNLQCNAIGIELNAEYIEIAKRRLSQEVLDFTHEASGV